MRNFCGLLTLLLLVSQCHSSTNHVRSLTSTDTNDCYGLVLDAGSTKTKVNVFQWECQDKDPIPKLQLTKIDKSLTKFKPLSNFTTNVAGIPAFIQDIITKIKRVIPSQQHASSPIMLGATAGLLALSQEDQNAIISQVHKTLLLSGFQYSNNWCKIIEGSQEGVFLWISSNYLQGSFSKHNQSIADIKTAATIDLGGASTQITFKVKQKENATSAVVLPQNKNYYLFSVSHQGFGNDLARNSVVRLGSASNVVQSGCFNTGHSFYTTILPIVNVIGTSNPQECIDKIKNFLNKKCQGDQVETCSINSSFLPIVPVDEQVIAVSGIYNAVRSFNISSPFRPQQLLEAATTFCQKTSQQVDQEDQNNDYRYNKCFLGLYTATLLSEGYNLQEYDIYSSNNINDLEPTWSMGFLIDNLWKSNYYDSSKKQSTDNSFFSSPQLIVGFFLFMIV